MGSKLLWTGLTFIQSVTLLGWGNSEKFAIAGAVVMAIGCVVMWMDK